jgi:drug/metabolite transporter (DMT)-like permease
LKRLVLSRPAAGSSLAGPLALLAAALIWGGSYSIIKLAVVSLPPLVLVACEYCLATLLLLPFALKRALRTPRRELGIAALLGLMWLAAAFTLFAALKSINPGLAAFLVTQTSIVTPILVGLTGGGWPNTRLWIALGVVLVGMGLIFLWGQALGLGFGVVLAIICMFALALHILVLNRVARKTDAVVLVLVQTAVTGAGGLILSLFLAKWPQIPSGFTIHGLTAIIYGAVGSSVLALLFQTLGQRRTPVSHVGLFLSFEGVFALIISIIAGIDRLTLPAGMGFAVVFGGTVLAHTGLRRREPEAAATEGLELKPPV